MQARSRAAPPVGNQRRPAAAACHPARFVTLLISDVPGDDPANIASGPTVPDPTTCADALAIIRRYGLDVPARVSRCWRADGANRSSPATRGSPGPRPA